ncbi:MAG: RES family NAD+ phosphorylase [Lewinellaceae bacterium]|nr:RES family NAD+ phosphorylase [candidate division KSB1 bacterium]MCB9035497.1 RES family NAD+ phosphorylase [Lewinellaceae bacterium]
MEVYRISRSKYADDISGTGARLYGGRWNPKGVAILYTAESRALAALELLVHLDPNLLPSDLKIITIKIPEELSFEILTKSELPENWKNYPAPFELGEIGEKWVFSKRTLGLKVPSVIIPEESNILINPLHDGFHRIEILEIEGFSIDDRLIKNQLE